MIINFYYKKSGFFLNFEKIFFPKFKNHEGDLVGP